MSAPTVVLSPRDDPAPASPEGLVRRAAELYGVDPDYAIAIVRCESSLRTDAVGDSGAALGLWQFHLPTWEANARRVFGRDVGDLRADPLASSLVASWMLARGQAWQWTCAR